MRSKNSTGKKNFYLPIIECLKDSTNLKKLQEKLGISKQQLNYYLRKLKKKGIIIQKSRGWYELIKEVKNLTKYGNLLKKDSIRGHAYIWNIKLPKIQNWENRLNIIKEKNIHYKLVGATKTVPRIKVLGRKIWLCNNHLRVFDKKGMSYYGNNAKQSRNNALNEILLIVGAIEQKLGVLLNPSDIYFKKEHYALIKNDLAIEHNRRGDIIHISDKEGEWLLIDDSLGEGGELETVGKKAYQTNIPMQKWWNDYKKTKFEVTPTFILNTMNGIQQNQLVFAENMKSHIRAIRDLSMGVKKLNKTVGVALEENKSLIDKLKGKSQKKLSDF